MQYILLYRYLKAKQDWQGKGYTAGNPKNVGCGLVASKDKPDAGCINIGLENLDIEGEQTITKNMINGLTDNRDQKNPWMSPRSIDLAPCGVFEGAR